MQCAKEFTISVAGQCIGLDADAAWTYDPNSNPDQPKPGLTWEVEGYYGTWTFVKSTGGSFATAPVVEWRVAWNSSPGRTLRVRATIVGTVSRVGLGTGANIIDRVNTNGNLLTSTQACPSGVSTAVSLDVTSTDATLVGAAFIDINHQVPSDGTYSLTGEIFVECV